MDRELQRRTIEMQNGDNSLSPSSYTVPQSITNPYINAATSDNTRKAYRQDIRHFEKWGGKLPATTDMVINYLQQFASYLNPRTLARRIVAIRNWHLYQAFQDPTNHPIVTKTMTGILKTHGKPKRKARALTPDDMRILVNYLCHQHSLASHRDHALLLIGYFGAFRRSELVAIKVEDIQWHKDGIDILIPTSKTDPTHEGQHSAIPYGKNELCPIFALRSWLDLAGITSGPLFRRITLGEELGDQALTPLSINHILKTRAKQAGLKHIDAISSHSLRRGLATSAARVGAPLKTIMRAGRWKQTNTVMEYIDEGEQFSDNAASHIFETLDP